MSRQTRHVIKLGRELAENENQSTRRLGQRTAQLYRVNNPNLRNIRKTRLSSVVQLNNQFSELGDYELSQYELGFKQTLDNKVLSRDFNWPALEVILVSR